MLATAVVTLVLILVLERTRVGALSLFVGVVGASALAVATSRGEVPLVRDLARIPRALPGLEARSLSHVPGMLVPAPALAFVGLVQGAAMSQSVPDPDGSSPGQQTHRG